MSDTVPMKLSTAIRLGAMMKPQRGIVGDWGDSDGACALQAAQLAIGNKEWRYRPCASTEARWPAISFTMVTCPECGETSDLMYAISICLNDHHRWTREAIADWVETIENHAS